jgi:hypothetical protein
MHVSLQKHLLQVVLILILLAGMLTWTFKMMPTTISSWHHSYLYSSPHDGCPPPPYDCYP